MKERILEILKLTRDNAISIENIYKKIYHTEIEDKQFAAVINSMEELMNEKQVYCTNSKKGLYTLNPFREGIFHIKRNGDCFVLSDGDYIPINSEKTLGCFEGDKVLVRVTDYNLFEGTIKEIIERHGIVAEVKTIDGKKYAICKNDKYQIELDPSIVDGMLIGIKIDKTKAGKYYHASLDRVLCHKNAPKIDEKKILYEYGILDGFTNATLEEVKSIPSSLNEKDYEGRIDLRTKTIFTIDGDDTKDIDDAISIEKKDDYYILGVHIADVTNYVKEGTSLDLDARLKGTSVYMPGVVSPMYPSELSNGICSLNPNVDRLALTCEMHYDFNGVLIYFDIYKSIIHSTIQMTYDKVNQILERNMVPNDYDEYKEILKTMEELSNILRSNRIKRGLLDFDSPEVKINVDDKGKVLNITLRSLGKGETLIENFMLAANETVATYLYNMNVNSIYRVHDYPNFERLEQTLNIIKNYGEEIDNKINIKDPKFLQKILVELKENKNFDIYSNMFLRCMAKACYSNINTGHFGIGIDSKKNEAYTHFTSPIRRYPDTTVHRVLKEVLEGNINKLQADEYKNNLIDIAKHSSEMEIVADNCEKEADKMKMADYMHDFIGQEYEAKIVGFTNHGMFVQLKNYVEGRIGYNTMDDFYNYSSESEMIIGERTKKIYRLGDKIKVRLIKASKEAREIDFEMVKKGDKNGNIKQKGKF